MGNHPPEAMIRLLYIFLCCTVLALAVSTAAMAADICYPPQSVNNEANRQDDVLARVEQNVNYSTPVHSSIAAWSETPQARPDESASLICPVPHTDVHTNIATN
jgi:hypothetical protein